MEDKIVRCIQTFREDEDEVIYFIAGELYNIQYVEERKVYHAFDDDGYGWPLKEVSTGRYTIISCQEEGVIFEEAVL